MPIFGKLSDMYGRKRFFVFGIAIFLLGSVLCGLTDNIVQLSIYRAIQGIGGGALMPIAFALMFDVFPIEKRGAMGGLFGAVFGISSLAGPLLGAFITDHLNWRWNFYINLPLGVLALLFIVVFYRESPGSCQAKNRLVGCFNLDWSHRCADVRAGARRPAVCLGLRSDPRFVRGVCAAVYRVFAGGAQGGGADHFLRHVPETAVCQQQRGRSGSPVFGILQRNFFASRLAESLAGTEGAAGLPSLDNPRTLLASKVRKAISAPVLERIVNDLSASITDMFRWTIVPAALALIAVLFMGNAKMLSHSRARGAAPSSGREPRPAADKE